MLNENEKTTIFLGYVIITLKELKYREIAIDDFIKKFERITKRIDEREAVDIFNKFIGNSTKQVIFEGIYIPVEYNMAKIRDIFESNDFIGKEYGYSVNRVFNALYRKNILLVKDLYGKTKKDIIRMGGIGEGSYNFFAQGLKKIFLCK